WSLSVRNKSHTSKKFSIWTIGLLSFLPSKLRSLIMCKSFPGISLARFGFVIGFVGMAGAALRAVHMGASSPISNLKARGRTLLALAFFLFLFLNSLSGSSNACTKSAVTENTTNRYGQLAGNKEIIKIKIR